MDFLGLRTDNNGRSKGLVKQSTGREIDLDKLPLDDEKTFAMLSQNTSGISLESSGMRSVPWELKPSVFEDIGGW